MERYPVEIFQIKYQIKNVLAYNVTYTFAVSIRKNKEKTTKLTNFSVPYTI